MQKKLEWETVRKKVNDLIPYEKNPRILSPNQEEELKKSLTKFNLVELPAINLDGKIIAGHQRVKILQLLGRKDEMIEVRIPNRKLTEAEYKEYLLRSNANTGSWNYEILQGFDLDLILNVGFEDKDLSMIFDENLEIEDDGFDEKKELEKAKSTNIKPGDLNQLGRHFLTCGNSHDPETLNKLMGKVKTDMIYNDPIYNIGVNYDRGIGGKASYGGNVKDSKSDKDYKEFLKAGLVNSLAHANKDCHTFTWSDQKYIWLIQTLYQELGIKNERACFWFKGSFNPTPNVAFNKAVEFCIYGTKGRPYLSKLSTKVCEIMNKEVSSGNRAIDDLFDIMEIWLAKRDAGQEYNHSTQKPLTLHEKPLLRCTKPGDVVLDIYGGSGSTLLSCEQLNRVCYTAEVSPIFCQLIINRWERLTSRKAVRLSK